MRALEIKAPGREHPVLSLVAFLQLSLRPGGPGIPRQLTPGDRQAQNGWLKEGSPMSKALSAVALFGACISQAFAGIIIPSIPTLDETGLIGLSLIIGIAAGIAARRRAKK